MLRYAVSLLLAACCLVEFAAAECLSNPEFNDFFAEQAGGPIPQEGSCCQQDVCGLPCPETTPEPGIGEYDMLHRKFGAYSGVRFLKTDLVFSHLNALVWIGYGIGVAVSIAISFLIGLATFFVVHGEAENYFVAGHSLPLWIVAMTLGAQSVDSNSLLGNVDLSYKYAVSTVKCHEYWISESFQTISRPFYHYELHLFLPTHMIVTHLVS